MSEQVKEKRVKKPKSKARKIIEWVLTGIFLALFAFVLAGQIDGMIHKKDHYNQQLRFGYGTFVVKTDSMEPKYMKKTAIITFCEDADKIYERFQKGQSLITNILPQGIIQNLLLELTLALISKWMASL